MLRFFEYLVLIMLVVFVFAKDAQAGDVREIGWAHLVPPSGQAEHLKSKGFLNRTEPALDGGARLFTQTPEAPWLSSPMPQPGNSMMPAVVAGLDGENVRIGGYVVPLEFNSTEVQEFLLVPFVGACIHVPPPPANQIIYVKAQKPFKLTGQFNAVHVTGLIRTKRQSTGLAATGYSMEASEVLPRTW